MAAVVSHAMRRYPLSPPDSAYSYGLRGDKSQKSWSKAEDGSSALSRSMRYADSWLYGSVRAPNGLLLAPAFVLCSCTDYLNGTKRSSKKGPTTCKKCKGARLPFSSTNDATKFGTVRCYPTTPPTAAPLRASGTVRVSSSSRPTILPTADPYDLMRRSRLLVPEGGSQFRARSISPSKNRVNETRSLSATRAQKYKSTDYNSTIGRKSILECDINPYELMSSVPDNNKKDSSITLLNGQRIRVRPSCSSVESSSSEYEDVQVRRPPTSNNKPSLIKNNITSIKKINRHSAPQILTIEKPSDTNRFKSILKKPTTTFSDTDSTSQEHSPSPANKSGSHFYLPMPGNTPRKKVQFLVENEIGNNNGNRQYQSNNNRKDVPSYANVVATTTVTVEKEAPASPSTVQVATPSPPSSTSTPKENQVAVEKVKESVEEEEDEEDEYNTCSDSSLSSVSDDKTKNNLCKLRRSVSERFNHESNKVIFHDTMALRTRTPRSDTRMVFAEKDLERLDGLTRTRKASPATNRPTKPPPPPPPPPAPPPSSSSSSTSEQPIKPLLKSLPLNTSLSLTNENNHQQSSRSNDEKDIEDIKEQETTNKNDLGSINVKTEIIQPESSPPSAPPRKRSNNKTPIQINVTNVKQTVKVESPPPPTNKTVVQINGSSIHRLQIKNEFSEPLNVQTVPVLENPQRKTSILINGDNCYSTVNVNDDIPLYQSSVVVKDSPETTISINNNKKSSSVYITGNFIVPREDKKEEPIKESKEDTKTIEEEHQEKCEETFVNNFNQNNIPSSELLKELLKDPVQAVKRNLVPHVCGKSDMTRRSCSTQQQQQQQQQQQINEQLDSPLDGTLEDSLVRFRNYESLDNCSEHSSSTQYELMDNGSECYTDHSNRSSVTEEELANRTKFYELLADSAIVEVENDDHHYESIKNNQDPIYEEIEIPPPLPSNPPPSSLLDDLQLDKEYTTRSIFEGASKYDILSYLVDAKERGIVQEDNYTYTFANPPTTINDDTKESYNRASHLSTVSDSSEDNSLIMSPTEEKSPFQKNAEVERNDSGVGSETSKSSLSKYRMRQETSLTCEDCETTLDNLIDGEPLICRKCIKKRCERKEIITEIVETEEKYSRDLQIILEEFYQPMLVAGLLTPEQLSAIFLNAEELLENSQNLAERLRDAVEIALEQGDEDLLTVNIGKLFLEAAPMLHGFETYCIRQGAASLLLASLEKEKELLRIFLRVSQMENTMLRRMNLNSFLMVPVQRVTKYPLLLARLYKVTPSHHETREQLKEAQHKIELHLNHMNSETKDVPSKLWRRIGSSSGRRSSAEMDLVNIKLRKIAVDVLEWNHDEAKFALEGKLLFTQPTDNNWRKGRTIKLTPINALLVINGKLTSSRPSEELGGLVFSKHSPAREAALLLVRDKNGRYSLLREPLYLDRCIIAADPAWQSYFEVQEILGKDTFIFKAEDEEQTRTWYTQLQFHAQGMGAWRKRRNALANIMINGMGLRT